MSITEFFEKAIIKLNLGKTILELSQVQGGLMHKMYKLLTDKGCYAIKLLNPEVMQRKESLKTFRKVEELEEVLQQNNILAIYAISFNNEKIQKINNQYFYVYNWYEGQILDINLIDKKHCELISKLLANIHNLNLQKQETAENPKYINWQYYINLAKNKNPILFKELSNKFELLNDFMLKGNIAIKSLPKISAICHNDLDVKNVLWINYYYKLIDLECLTYRNPYLELLDVALYWSKFEKNKIDFHLFKTFIKTYFKNIKLNTNIDWSSIYYANNNYLKWLEFNIKRVLFIDQYSKEEQELGLKEVTKTINKIVCYLQNKDNILNILKLNY